MTDHVVCFAVNTLNSDSNLCVDVQNALEFTNEAGLPTEKQLRQWASIAYQSVYQLSDDFPAENEVSIRLVEVDEIVALNNDYRGKSKPTNVLSFPFDVSEEIDIALLGDVVICHDVVAEEALAANKTIEQHYAHMVTHGILHLCGYDHQCDQTANEMESLEIQILAKSGLPNPYVE